jgi:hypothetical protein
MPASADPETSPRLDPGKSLTDQEGKKNPCKSSHKQTLDPDGSDLTSDASFGENKPQGISTAASSSRRTNPPQTGGDWGRRKEEVSGSGCSHSRQSRKEDWEDGKHWEQSRQVRVGHQPKEQVLEARADLRSTVFRRSGGRRLTAAAAGNARGFPGGGGRARVVGWNGRSGVVRRRWRRVGWMTPSAS